MFHLSVPLTVVKLNSYRDVIYKINSINKKTSDELLKLINSINEEVIVRPMNSGTLNFFLQRL